LVDTWTAKYIPDGSAADQAATNVTNEDRQMSTSASGDNSNLTSDWRIASYDSPIGTSGGLQLIGMRQQ
jgi:hypothetical protein